MLVRAAEGDADYDWAAGVMSSNEPWLTFGRTYEQSREFMRRNDTELFIAWDDDARTRLGYLLLSERGMASAPYVTSLAVDAPARGGGVGSELLRFAERRYPDAKHIFICVSSFNTRARQLYERVGYKKVGELPDYIIAGHAELILHKRLK